MQTSLLTRDGFGVVNDLGDFIVDIYKQVVLGGEVRVAFVDHRGDPRRERLLDDTVAHIDDELPRELIPVDLVRQVLQNLRVLPGFGKHFSN